MSCVLFGLAVGLWSLRCRLRYGGLVPLKVRDMIKEVEADVWAFDRFRGTSHRQYKHPTKIGTVTITGALHVELDRGTEANIRRQAGIK